MGNVSYVYKALIFASSKIIFCPVCRVLWRKELSMSSVIGNMDVPSRKNRGKKKRKDGRKQIIKTKQNKTKKNH